MRLKDYYRTLEVKPSATGDEVKRAFRRLAMKYHPDHNADNPFAEGHFRELKEAYNILGNEKSRRKYDDERWLTGATAQAKQGMRNSVAGLLHETARLRRHMETVDTYRMNQPALQHYVLLLLGDELLDRLRLEGSTEAAGQVVEDILAATRHLRAALLAPVEARLLLLAGDRQWLQEMVRTVCAERRKAAEWERRFPLMMAIAFLAIGLLVLALRFF